MTHQRMAKPPIKQWWMTTMDDNMVQGLFFSVYLFLLFSFLLITYYSFRHPPSVYAMMTTWRRMVKPPIKQQRWTMTVQGLFFLVCVFYYHSHFLWLLTILLDIHHLFMRQWQWQMAKPPIKQQWTTMWYRGFRHPPPIYAMMMMTRWWLAKPPQ